MVLGRLWWRVSGRNNAESAPATDMPAGNQELDDQGKCTGIH